jgi:hypothetical protein
MSGSWLPAEFPNLHEADHEITSPATEEYNCIAWAAGDTESWWWPDEMETAYWPSAAPRQVTRLAFVLAYGTLGYVPCNDGTLEEGFEKTVLYEDVDGQPTHAARQLPDGRWASKLGPHEDIEHRAPECLEGPCYGKVVQYLKRPIC